MKNVIIGTAGHIDHGKTTLIKALTGRETDTLEEEKRRGICPLFFYLSSKYFAAITTFCKSMAIVIGPTPPGTGVI